MLSKKKNLKSQTSVEDKFRSPKEVFSHRTHVFYGRSGTGKTTLASTFPKPILLLDINDQGTDSIADVKELDVLDIRDWDTFLEVYWWLTANPKRYKTIVIDTTSQLQGACIEHVLKKKQLKGNKRAGDWGTMTMREWGEVSALMKTWITNVKGLPMEVVFVAQDRVFNTSEETEAETMLDPEVGPRLSPSVAAHLNAVANVIGNTFIRQRTQIVKEKTSKGIKKKEVPVTQYCLRVGPNPTYVTKIRKPRAIKPPSVIVDPSYDKILAIIKGEA